LQSARVGDAVIASRIAARMAAGTLTVTAAIVALGREYLANVVFMTAPFFRKINQ
jgi:hypothetical protein